VGHILCCVLYVHKCGYIGLYPDSSLKPYTVESEDNGMGVLFICVVMHMLCRDVEGFQKMCGQHVWTQH
jgi:hypothetical protein